MAPIEKFQLIALPIVLGASWIEAWLLERSKSGDVDWNEARLSLIDLVGRHLLAFLPISIAAPVFQLAWAHRVHSVELNSVLAFVLVFLGQEFCYYWYHRASHRIRLFWATHAVHHSPNTLRLSTAYRLGWTGKLTGAAVFFTPLVWLGVRPEVVLATLSLNLLYQFWLHTTWIPKLGWLENVLNTPSSHRVHHSANLEHLDVNYGGVLIIFDRLFGTYVAERDDLPCRYGLVTPLRSANPLVIEFRQWMDLGRDLLRADGLLAVIGYLVGPPGWQPDGTGNTTEAMRRRAELAHTKQG